MALGDVNIIGDVTQTLANLLVGLDVTLDSPATLPTSGAETFAKVNLYLYQVLEDAYSKNQPWVTGDSGNQEYPPLALDLYYLLTPYASDPLSAHGVLSHVMEKLYDHPTISGSDLAESLRLSVDHLAVVLVPLKLEELTRIWNALQTPYRLSVSYEVRVVLLASALERVPKRVITKINEYAQR